MRRLALLAALAALLLTAPAQALAPLPERWPKRLEIGLSDPPGGAADLRRSARFGFRYQYLGGGVNTGDGWATWNSGGSFVSAYAAESRRARVRPVFTYYMIRQSLPGRDDSDEPRAVLSNLRNGSTMRAYWEDLRLFFQRAGAAGGTQVLHVEPDMWGYGQQAASGDDAASVPAAVGSSGVEDVAGLPDDLTGFAQAVVRLRDRYAPNVLLAYHVSVWGTRVDIALSDPPSREVDALAARAARFQRSLGARFDITFSDPSDRDAGFKQLVYGDNGASWWTGGDFRRNARFLRGYSRAADQRVALWQIPLGNTVMRAMDNSWGHYQDNRAQWFLADRTRRHLKLFASSGAVALLFGGGAEGTTCACDARRDGVTNPAPIGRNTRRSLSADDDGGFFRSRVRAYYRRGPLRIR